MLLTFILIGVDGVGSGCTLEFQLPVEVMDQLMQDALNSQQNNNAYQAMNGALTDGDYCEPTESWNSVWSEFEERIIALVNAARAEGASCGSYGYFEPAAPLARDQALKCAARRHSLDMAALGFFDHVRPDGENPGDRVDKSGFSALTWGENIAFGYVTPEQVVEGWMNSPGHCANIMNPEFTHTGAGYYAGNFWTESFGTPDHDDAE